MPSPLPDLSAPIWDAQLAGLLERAILAIGRLDARISVSPVRQAWIERASWTGFAAARRGQGLEIEEIDIFSLACAIVIPRRQAVAFAEEEVGRLRDWQQSLMRSGSPHWSMLIPITLELPPDWGVHPALLRTLELVARHARADRGDAPWLGMPALLKALGITHAPLPCLVAADKALRLAPRDRGAIVPRYLKALAGAATEGLARLDAMEQQRLRGARAIAEQRRPGALARLTALLQRRPLVSPLSVARVLGLTVSGGGKLLDRAAGAGLVVEISGPQAWKTYLVPDLAIALGFTPRPLGRPPARDVASPLDEVLARFDAEMTAIDAVLADLDAG